MTKQEMFDKAWAGLKAQNWVRCVTDRTDSCTYAKRDAAGNVIARCAWGHVDPAGTENYGSGLSVGTLHDRGLGLAATLEPGDDLTFARRLQEAHDAQGFPYEVSSPWEQSSDMEQRLRALAAFYDLAVPE